MNEYQSEPVAAGPGAQGCARRAQACDDCGEECGNHAAGCAALVEPEGLWYDPSLDPISPLFDPRSWQPGDVIPLDVV